MKQNSLHILLVDDHRTTNILNKLLLQKFSEVTAVDTAKNIREAYAQIEANNFDIILIDRDLLLTEATLTLKEFKYMSDANALFVLLSGDQLSITKKTYLMEELGIEEVKFKILTKYTAKDIINAFYNKSKATTSGSTI